MKNYVATEDEARKESKNMALMLIHKQNAERASQKIIIADIFGADVGSIIELFLTDSNHAISIGVADHIRDDIRICHADHLLFTMDYVNTLRIGYSVNCAALPYSYTTFDIISWEDYFEYILTGYNSRMSTCVLSMIIRSKTDNLFENKCHICSDSISLFEKLMFDIRSEVLTPRS